MEPDRSLAEVALALGYAFESPDLLRDALTHRSLANERPRLAPRDNERLEFLGDSIVGLVAASLLYDRFPDAAEGELSRRRADLVCEASLADIARAIGLGDALRLGRGEERSGGRQKARLLASALEACIAAVYLDGGIDAAIDTARRLLAPRVEELVPGAFDFKSRVQELVQARGEPTPRYELVEVAGPSHEPSFRVAIVLAGAPVAEGTGGTKAEAEQAAAAAALAILGEGPPDGERSDEPA